MKDEALKILLLEDNETDAEIIQHLLKKEVNNLVFKHVSKKDDFEKALDEFVPDVILSDYSLPQFTAKNALKIVMGRGLKTPFIIISGTISEDFAAHIVEYGADDYLLKDRLTRLPGAIANALKRRRTENEKAEAQQKLAESENYLRTIIETEPECVKLLNSNGKIETMNPAGLAMIEADNLEQIAGKSILDIIDEPFHKKQNELIKNVFNNVSGKMEFTITGLKGGKYWLETHAVPLKNTEGKIIFMLGITRDVTEKKKAEQQLIEEKIKRQKLIAETFILAQEEERNELGKELHDNISQILTTVKMYLGLAKGKDIIPVDLIEESYKYVNEVMDSIRKLSHTLVAPSLSASNLKDALRKLVKEANLIEDMQLRLFVDEKYNEKEVDKKKELTLYRIVQEQLNNIIKHAGANEVIITLKRENENLVLNVTDNGIGFNDKLVSEGIGIRNIKNRVDFYGGTVNIITAPNKGCTLEICIHD